MVCANAGLWFVGHLGLAGDTSDEIGRTACTSPRQTRTRELSASYPRAAHPWTTTPGRACGKGACTTAAGSVGHSGRVTEVEGACLFWVGAVSQLEDPGGGAEPVFGSANGLRSGGRGGRGVAGLTRGLPGAHRAQEREFAGCGTRNPGVGAVGCKRWRRDGAARTWWWSSVTPR